MRPLQRGRDRRRGEAGRKEGGEEGREEREEGREGGRKRRRDEGWKKGGIGKREWEKGEYKFLYVFPRAGWPEAGWNAVTMKNP